MTTKYILTVGTDIKSIKSGYFMRQTIPDYDSADILYRQFSALGAICYLSAVECEKVGTRVNNDELADMWGVKNEF